jgi:hypothetical protein
MNITDSMLNQTAMLWAKGRALAWLLTPMLLLGQQAQADEADLADAARVLDALHREAAQANWDKYFALYRKDAVFLGTDASERWNMMQFEGYARPTQGWRYEVTDRKLIQLDKVILFDELLENDGYGVSRGTGALVLTDDEWKLAQYHLSFPIPNAMAKEITAKIKAGSVGTK